MKCISTHINNEINSNVEKLINEGKYKNKYMFFKMAIINELLKHNKECIKWLED